ncbi:hypothetical protein B9Z55_012420 [Caenorhabditis nigoni]|uniref:SUN domain-containing protein n=1 Tax=Caenorhabditis nigoni TaxID=1611254 RepID=A0A2G5TX71_9PELO|nr:hypothetical protein B9Z55_012420 [Caenorhabditis nigoni]
MVTFDTDTKRWYHWFNIRIRQYMILEMFFFISLIMIFYRLQTISNQNNQVIEMVYSLKSQIMILESKVVTGKPNEERNYENTKPLEQYDLFKKPEIPMKPVISENSKSKNDSISKEEPFRLFNAAGYLNGASVDNTKPLEQSIAEILKNIKNIMESINLEKSTHKTSIPKGPFRFNAANYLHGAYVDTAYSSSSNLNTFIGLDQTNLVLLDRPQPPKNKAWCSNEHNPVLTINLAKNIKPVYVSYQHAKWHGFIPNEAPRVYDVVACIDVYCKNWEPLVSNCKYNQFGSNGTEQFCNISTHLDVPLVGKVQFRFRENYGDSQMTCVHLVRVYEETHTHVITETKKDFESEKICKELKHWFYYGFYTEYALEVFRSFFGVRVCILP